MSQIAPSSDTDTSLSRKGKTGGSARRALGPYSRPPALAKLDGRSKEARLLKQIRQDFTAHLGGAPSATQRALIERAAQLSLRIAAMDAKFAETGQQTEHDSRTYLAWSASLTRLMKQLGLKGAAARTPTLAEHKAMRGAS